LLHLNSNITVYNTISMMRGPPDTINNDESHHRDQLNLSPPSSIQNLIRLDPTAVLNDSRDGIIISEPPSSSPDSNNNANDLIEQYGWMADFDEIDKQIREEIYIEQCFEDMWREEQMQPATSTNQRTTEVENIENSMDKLTVTPSTTITSLNPNATEFVPRSSSSRRQ